MFKRKGGNNTGERGMLMLEALLVYPVTMFMLLFILAAFSVLYQRRNLQTVDNEATMRMAQTYRLSMADNSTGYAEEEDYVEIGAYRYAISAFTENMKEPIFCVPALAKGKDVCFFLDGLYRLPDYRQRRYAHHVVF